MLTWASISWKKSLQGFLVFFLPAKNNQPNHRENILNLQEWNDKYRRSREKDCVSTNVCGWMSSSTLSEVDTPRRGYPGYQILPRIGFALGCSYNISSSWKMDPAWIPAGSADSWHTALWDGTLNHLQVVRWLRTWTPFGLKRQQIPKIQKLQKYALELPHWGAGPLWQQFHECAGSGPPEHAAVP